MRNCIERAFYRLRGYCDKKPNCDNCRFADNEGHCVMYNTVPADWKMPKESEEDND